MAADDLQFSHAEFRSIDQDYEQAAVAADLRYVRDNAPGILRTKKGTGFAYHLQGEVVKDEKHLERIRKLVIPPAWTNVWICASPKGHIQATGIDLRRRKQYRYHTLWNSLRSMTKFHRLIEFGKALPLLRQKLNKDISLPGLPEEKVLATVISLMEQTSIRVGNAEYEKMNGSYGLTTMKDKHVGINGARISFSFKGKKGIYHNITLQNKKLAKIVKQCRDIPGRELFQYYGPSGEKNSIDSGGVNQYIKEATKEDFTAKDFRLWAGSVNILEAFQEMGQAATVAECKQNIIAALEIVSKKLGNTRTVCRKYYVHPGLIKLYEENSLQRFLKEPADSKENSGKFTLSPSELILMKILKNLN
jgi:DNA topoisomerase I